MILNVTELGDNEAKIPPPPGAMWTFAERPLVNSMAKAQRKRGKGKQEHAEHLQARQYFNRVHFHDVAAVLVGFILYGCATFDQLDPMLDIAHAHNYFEVVMFMTAWIETGASRASSRPIP